MKNIKKILRRISILVIGIAALGVGQAQAYVGNFLQTFQEFPPRMKAASFSLEKVMEQMQNPGSH